jgi:hypothetical protein
MYIETDDKPSIFELEPDQVQPGLRFEPPWEMDDRDLIQAGTTVKEPVVVSSSS